MSAFELRSEGNVLTVALGGDLTAAVVSTLKPAVQKAIDDGVANVTFDLGKAIIVDSTGIGFMIAVYNTLARKKGATRVTNVSADIMRLLQSMRLDQRLGASAAS